MSDAHSRGSRGRPPGGDRDHQAGAVHAVPRMAHPDVSDLDLAEFIASTGYDLSHPDVRIFVGRLRNICAGTLQRMRSEGTLFPKCASLGMLSLPPRPLSWDADAERLFAVTAEIASPRFVTDKLVEWLPERAALRTFFINCCLFDFEKIYRAFCKEEDYENHEQPHDNNVIDLFQSSGANPESVVLDKIGFRQVIAMMDDPRITRIILLIARGYNREAVAQELSLSVSTIYRMLEQFRRKLNQNGFSIERGRTGE